MRSRRTRTWHSIRRRPYGALAQPVLMMVLSEIVVPHRRASDSVASESLAPVRLAPERLAPDRMAPDRFVCHRLAPDRSALDKLEPDRSALNRLARPRFAPNRLTPAGETGRRPRDRPVHPAGKGWCAGCWRAGTNRAVPESSKAKLCGRPQEASSRRPVWLDLGVLCAAPSLSACSAL